MRGRCTIVYRVEVRLQDVALSIKRLQQRHHRALDTQLRKQNSSLSQWDALRHIDRNPGSSTHDLAELTFMTDQSFGALAIKLADLGLIRRTPGHGRAVLHDITHEGSALLNNTAAIADGVFAHSFAPLRPDEVATLAGLLSKLLTSDCKYNGPAADEVVRAVS